MADRIPLDLIAAETDDPRLVDTSGAPRIEEEPDEFGVRAIRDMTADELAELGLAAGGDKTLDRENAIAYLLEQMRLLRARVGVLEGR